MALDPVNCIADVWYRLGFSSSGDMATANRWVTIAELYQFADDHAKALARSTGALMTYDASTAVLNGTPAYLLPGANSFTESAWLIYAGSVQILRITGVAQLFALDAAWPAASGPPTRISLDALAIDTCVLYPSPVAAATLALVMEAIQPDVVLGGGALPLNPVLQDMMSYAMLAGARSKESDSRDGPMAAHFAERVKLYLSVVEALWGPGN